MDSFSSDGKITKVRRITMAELSEILDGVAKLRGKDSEISHVGHLRSRAESMRGRTQKVKKQSKAAACGAPERILALVALHPEWGTTRLAESLAEAGISLSRQSIHKILVKHNLNRPALRKARWVNQEETKP